VVSSTTSNFCEGDHVRPDRQKHQSHVPGFYGQESLIPILVSNDTKVFLDMRLWTTLISAQMWAAVASAETLPDRVVSLLKDICVTPTSSEEKMTVGEKTAVKENWKLFRSRPAPKLREANLFFIESVQQQRPTENLGFHGFRISQRQKLGRNSQIDAMPQLTTRSESKNACPS
jgi:hypothetical protein